MAVSDRRNNIDRQLLQIEMNTRFDNEAVPAQLPVLPYDPNQPPDTSTDPVITATNYIDNSDFDFSKDVYLNNPAVGGDQAEECYNWFRQRFRKLEDVVTTATSTAVSSASAPFNAAYTYPMDFVLLNGGVGGVALSGTLTRVDDNNATLSVAATPTMTSAVLWFGETLSEAGGVKAVKSSTHSLYAANEGANINIPRWDKTNGWVEMASDDAAQQFDMACPLAVNFVRPGLKFYFRCIVKLRSGATTNNPIRMAVGIWDATTTQKRFLEGSNFDLTAAVVGTTGATSYQYVVIADLDDGTTIMSDTVTVTNGNATLSSSNYIRLTWQNATGVLRFRIYRKVSGVTKRVFTITNGGSDFNDTGGDEGETPADLPSSSAVRALAYAVSTEFNPSAGVWAAIRILLQIPATYNSSNTTGKQWMRIGIEGIAGDERMILIDRVMLSTSDAGWQRSSRDFNKILNQNPSSLPVNSDQGDTGIDDTCFSLDTPILQCDRDGTNVRETPIGELEPGDFVVSGSGKANLVTKIRSKDSRRIVTVTMSNRIEFECTPSERFITSRADTKGTRIDELTLGDEIMCWNNGRVEKATIERYAMKELRVPVKTLSLRPTKTFIAAVRNGNGVIAHNQKPLDILQ